MPFDFGSANEWEDGEGCPPECSLCDDTLQIYEEVPAINWLGPVVGSFIFCRSCPVCNSDGPECQRCGGWGRYSKVSTAICTELDHEFRRSAFGCCHEK